MLHTILAGSQTSRVKPTFVSSSTNQSAATTNTVSAPSGIQNGDLLVAVCFCAGQGTLTPPSGFNASYLANASLNTIALATKVASSESGSYAFTWSVSFGNTIAILVYRNATAINTIGTTTQAAGTATGTAASITPTYVGTLCAIFGNESSRTITTPPSGFTQRAAQTAAAAALAVYDLENQAATATSAASLVWSSTGDCASVQFQVTNEPDVTPTLIATAQTQTPGGGTSLVVNKPTGTADGDLMIAVMASNGSNTWTGDTSWTEVADQGTLPSLSIAYKVAGASEPSSYTFTSSLGNALTGCILTYRYAAYDTAAGSFTTAANPLLLTSVSTALSQSKLLAIGARGAASITLGTPISMTAQVTDNDGTASSYIVCDQTVPKCPTGTRSMSTGSTTNVAGIMLAIKPTRSL